jgi:hypothetical protein
MTKKIYDLVATVGEYTNKTTGEKKKRTINVGSVFQKDDSYMFIKLESIPVGPEWSGWLSCYEPKGAGDSPRGQSRAQQDDNSDIPF